jgi:DTW domain-containing protein
MRVTPKRPGRGYRSNRCAGCGLPSGPLGAHCPCSTLPRIENRSAVTILAHFCEIRKPTNTSRLAARVLSRCRILQLGAPAANEEHGRDTARAAGVQLVHSLAALDPLRTLLLYPSDSAIPLEQALSERNTGNTDEGVELLVPDGTWAETRRLVRRYPALQQLCAVRLPDRPSVYALRRNAVPGLLCTLEAIACALGTVDGPDVQQALLSAFDTWQAAALVARRGATKAPAQSLPSPVHAASELTS